MNTHHDQAANSMEKPIDLIGVGAPIMDVLAWVPESFLAEARGEKGGMVMVDADESARLLSLLPAKPTLTTGGSAANTIYNGARLGLRTAFIGKLGNDEMARMYEDHFAKNGVETKRFKRGPLPNGRCISLITPDAQRTMRTYLGAHATLSPAEVTAADFSGCRHLHLEGYVVFNQELADTILAAARAAGCTISLDLASFEVVRGVREWLLTQLEKGIDVVFSNEDEIRALFPDMKASTPEELVPLVKRLASYGGIAGVKMGKDGAWIADKHGIQRVISVPLQQSDMVDSTGAGDAWQAGFLAMWLRGHSLEHCGKAGSILGAETMKYMGPLVPEANWSAISSRVAELTQ